MKLPRIPIWIGLVLVSAVALTFADDDSQPPAQMFPNRMQVTPAPEKPRPRVIGIPNQEGAPGAPLSPGASSQMGIGIQIPFGKTEEPAPQSKAKKKKLADPKESN